MHVSAKAEACSNAVSRQKPAQEQVKRGLLHPSMLVPAPPDPAAHSEGDDDSDKSSGVTCVVPGKAVILIGAPSAAGKTYFSLAVLAGKVMPFPDILPPAASFLRYDLKSVPSTIQDDKIPIIEVATQRMQRYVGEPYWRNMVAVLEERNVIIHLTLDVRRSTLIKNYFFRIFTGRKKSRLGRFDISSYFRQNLRLIRYIVTKELAKAQQDWEDFGRKLGHDRSRRVIFARVVAKGSSYRISVQPE